MIYPRFQHVKAVIVSRDHNLLLVLMVHVILMSSVVADLFTTKHKHLLVLDQDLAELVVQETNPQPHQQVSLLLVEMAAEQIQPLVLQVVMECVRIKWVMYGVQTSKIPKFHPSGQIHIARRTQLQDNHNLPLTSDE